MNSQELNGEIELLRLAIKWRGGIIQRLEREVKKSGRSNKTCRIRSTSRRNLFKTGTFTMLSCIIFKIRGK